MTEMHWFCMAFYADEDPTKRPIVLDVEILAEMECTAEDEEGGGRTFEHWSVAWATFIDDGPEIQNEAMLAAMDEAFSYSNSGSIHLPLSCLAVATTKTPRKMVKGDL